jgi:protein SCO1/2
VPLVTHEGKRVRFYTDLVKDRIVFVNMMYAQCSEQCPPMTQNLRRVQEAAGGAAGPRRLLVLDQPAAGVRPPADLRPT